ncbi:MAG: peptidylprolyl isomerase [Acidimicrobiales bacterium]
MKRLALLVVVGALSLAASACDLSPPAVSADGVTVSRAQLDAQLSTVADDSVAQCALSVLASESGSSVPAVAGSGDDTVTTQFAAFTLTGLVRQVVEEHGLAEDHATVSAADVAAARSDFESQLTAAAAQTTPPCGLTGSALVERLPKAFLDAQARLLADDERLEEVAAHIDVTPAALRTYYDTHQLDVTEECVNLIVATSQAAAQTIHDQIAAGESFATADQGAGVDPNGPTGGQEPCVFPSTIASQLGEGVAATLAVLPLGGVAPPQAVPVSDPQTGQSSTLWIVVGMRQRQVAPFATVEGGIRLQLLQQGQTALTTVLTRLSRQIHVHLDPRYGTWSVRTGVVPPPAPPAAFVLNPAAGQSASGSSSLVVPGS